MAVSTTNPWALGAVVFNQQPWMAFYERQAAKKEAKEDALNNYFRDLGKNITSTGMRSQDVPVLLRKNKDWQNFYAQNKAAIINPKLDNGAAYSKYMEGYQDQLGAINESKGALKAMDEIGKMKLNPQMSYVFDDPHFMDQIQKHELPINDPNRQGINLASISLPPKPIDTKEWDAYNKYLIGNIPHDKILGQTQNLPGFKTRTPIYQQYSPENQMVIGQHAANAYDTDKRWRAEGVKYFNELQHNPEEYTRVNSVYKQLYGNDIDDPKEAWVAKGILDNNMKATEYREGKDELGMAKFMEALRHANARDLIEYRKKIDPNDTELNNTWVETYLGNRINAAKADNNNLHVIYNSKSPNLNVKGYFIKPDAVMMKAFTRGAGKDAVEPDRIYVTEDNKIMPIFYKYEKDAKGNVIQAKNSAGHPLIDEDYSQPMDLDQAMLTLGYRGQTKKDLGKTMAGRSGGSKAPSASYKYNGKSYTHKELNDMGYDDNEIDQAIKAGIISK